MQVIQNLTGYYYRAYKEICLMKTALYIWPSAELPLLNEYALHSKGRKMSTVGNSKKTTGLRNASGIRIAKPALIILLCYFFYAQQSVAQTSATRYLKFGGYVIPFTTLVAPNLPTIITIFSVFKYQVPVSVANVSWTAAVDADQYKLELFDATAGQWNLIYDGPSTLFIAENLSVASHYFRIRSCGGGICSAVSPSVAVVIVPNPDMDLDGYDDADDLCPNSLENAVVTGAGCVAITDGSDDDDDDDGVTDDLDWCDGTLPSDVADVRGCSPDQYDADDDGIADYLDSYPQQSATQCTP